MRQARCLYVCENKSLTIPKSAHTVSHKLECQIRLFVFVFLCSLHYNLTLIISYVAAVVLVCLSTRLCGSTLSSGYCLFGVLHVLPEVLWTLWFL